MAIIDREERALWPRSCIFVLWPRHIQDDWNPVFVIIPLYTLMGISWVTCYQAVRLWCILSVLEVFQWVERLISISVHKESIRLEESLGLSLNYAIDANLLIFNLPLHLLNDRVEFAELIRQALLELNLRNLLLIFFISLFLTGGPSLSCATWS